MSLSTALGLLLTVAALLSAALEVTREIGDHPRLRPWRSFVGGALAAVVLVALIATFALFRDALA